MSLDGVLSGITLEFGTFVKSQTQFSQFYDGYGFFGTLASFANDQMFALKMNGPATLTIQGTPVALPMTVMINGGGWTYLPMPYQVAMPIGDWIPTGVEFDLGDQVKSQFEFSQFYPGYGWFGVLSNVELGAGYMMLLASTARGGVGTFEAH